MYMYVHDEANRWIENVCLVHQSLASLAPTYLTAADIHLVSEYTVVASCAHLRTGL